MSASNEEILTALAAKCEKKGDHLISTIYYDVGFRGELRRPATWFYLCTNNMPDLPKNTRMASYCQEERCICHSMPVTEKYECITLLNALDVLYILARLQHVSEKTGECATITKLKPNAQGYVQMGMLGQDWFAHVLAYCVHHGINREDIPKDMQVAHDCGNRRCVNIEHLILKTLPNNAKDKVKHNTAPSGEQNPNALITEEVARKIILSYGTGRTSAQRAVEFKVSRNIIRSIDAGQSWKHLFTAEDWQKRESKKRKRTTTEESGSKRAKITDSKETFFKKMRERIKMNIKVQSDDDRKDHWIWIRAKIKANGYGKTSIEKNPWITANTSHRLAYQVFRNRELDEDVLVLHDCKRKDCCNPDHLKEGSHQDNADDTARDGTRRFGENHPSAKITAEVAKKIKESKGDGTRKERAKRFSTTISTVGRIDAGKSWASV